MKKVISTLLFFRKLLTRKKPLFDKLSYTRIIIQHQAYFLFSWQTSNTFLVRIPSLHFRSRLSCGSAFVHIPEDVTHIELIITNAWNTVKIPLSLALVPSEKMIMPPTVSVKNTLRPVYLSTTPQARIAGAQVKTPLPVPLVSRLYIHNTIYRS
jgi:hypothetical protein